MIFIGCQIKIVTLAINKLQIKNGKEKVNYIFEFISFNFNL